VATRIGTRLFWSLFALLVLVRVPSLAQPAGADQSLYAYVGQRILHGELAYRDAWDQKPPAIHFTYALLWSLWPDERVVAAADLLVAVLTALVVWRLGRRLGPPGAGECAAVVFLLLGNPALGRLGGVRVRGQCEVFIGLASSVAFLLLHQAASATGAAYERTRRAVAAGALFGVAFLYKYNAGAMLLAGLVAAWLWTGVEAGRPRWRGWLGLTTGLATGCALVVAVGAVIFMAGGALNDLYRATIDYNLFYSGETYDSRLDLLVYLFTFPIRHARIDSLWFLGGLGCLLLLGSGRISLAAKWGRAEFAESATPLHGLAVVAWVAAACLSIAVNGSRGLPQYFVQAYPALALAFGLAAALVWRVTRPRTRALAALLVAIAVVRISNFDKIADYTAWDLRAWAGSLTRDEYLSRFGGRATGDKYSALAVHELAQHLRARVPSGGTVLLFGFSPGALVQSERRSATRFFWSRPIIVGFADRHPGYGVSALLEELDRNRPALVVLQRHDWDPDGPDSYTFFTNRADLMRWLVKGYSPAGELGNFALWERGTVASASPPES
jgi:hypothetical protein